MSKVVKKQFATTSNITQIKIYRFLVSKSWVILATIQCIVDWHSEYPPAIKLQLYCHTDITVASSPSPPTKIRAKTRGLIGGNWSVLCDCVCLCLRGVLGAEPSYWVSWQLDPVIWINSRSSKQVLIHCVCRHNIHHFPDCLSCLFKISIDCIIPFKSACFPFQIWLPSPPNPASISQLRFWWRGRQGDARNVEASGGEGFPEFLE